MVLDFEKMPVTPMEHFKGGEGTLGLRKFDDPAMGAVVRLTMPAGSTIGMHTHVGNCEVVYVLAGSGVCYYDDTVYPVKAGSIVYCPEHHAHSICNTGEEVMELLGVLPKSCQ